MSANIFARRKPAFQEGFIAFLDGIVDCPYSHHPRASDKEYNDAQEWKHGWDVAYLEMQKFAVRQSARHLNAA